jgi:hypothetical protein
VGSTNRPQLREQLTPEQTETLLDKALEKAEAGDSLMLKFSRPVWPDNVCRPGNAL